MVGVHGGWKDHRPSAHAISIYRFKGWDYLWMMTLSYEAELHQLFKNP